MSEPIPTADFLRRAFATEQVCLEAQLNSSERIVHRGDRGEVNEQHFIQFLRKYLPNRYTVDKAAVIDSRGETSQSIDVVVYDRQYTPALLDNDKHRYVPAEAVYAVFECKSEITKGNLKYAGRKAASVRRLYRTSVDVHTLSGQHKKKDHFHIIAGILAIRSGGTEGLSRTFADTHSTLTGNHSLECGFAVRGDCFDMFDGKLNTFGPSENALAYFAFRLLYGLQRLATAPAVDWMAYANNLSADKSKI